MSDSMLGKVFALSDATEQAEFLNTVARVMRSFDNSTSGMGEDMQLWRIIEKLDANGRRLVARLGEMVGEPK